MGVGGQTSTQLPSALWAVAANGAVLLPQCQAKGMETFWAVSAKVRDG